MEMTRGEAQVRVAVDALVFTVADGELRLALIRRLAPVQVGWWALPGGFVLEGETLEQAVERELREEANVSDVYLEQLYTFSALDRDPRARIISTAYIALAPEVELRASTDASEARWFPVTELPELAFDHAAIVEMGVERLRTNLLNRPVARCMFREEFRLSELLAFYEAALGRPLDKRNFLKRLRGQGFVEETGEIQRTGAHRPARLFRFKQHQEAI